MTETRQSLLLRAQAGDPTAWRHLTELYRPLIDGWLHRQGVPARDLEDLSYEEISAITELPVGTVKSRIHRARAQVRERVERELGESIE